MKKIRIGSLIGTGLLGVGMLTTIPLAITGCGKNDNNVEGLKIVMVMSRVNDDTYAVSGTCSNRYDIKIDDTKGGWKHDIHSDTSLNKVVTSSDTVSITGTVTRVDATGDYPDNGILVTVGYREAGSSDEFKTEEILSQQTSNQKFDFNDIQDMEDYLSIYSVNCETASLINKGQDTFDFFKKNLTTQFIFNSFVQYGIDSLTECKAYSETIENNRFRAEYSGTTTFGGPVNGTIDGSYANNVLNYEFVSKHTDRPDYDEDIKQTVDFNKSMTDKNDVHWKWDEYDKNFTLLSGATNSIPLPFATTDWTNLTMAPCFDDYNDYLDYNSPYPTTNLEIMGVNDTQTISWTDPETLPPGITLSTYGVNQKSASLSVNYLNYWDPSDQIITIEATVDGTTTLSAPITIAGIGEPCFGPHNDLISPNRDGACTLAILGINDTHTISWTTDHETLPAGITLRTDGVNSRCKELIVNYETYTATENLTITISATIDESTTLSAPITIEGIKEPMFFRYNTRISPYITDSNLHIIGIDNTQNVNWISDPVSLPTGISLTPNDADSRYATLSVDYGTYTGTGELTITINAKIDGTAMRVPAVIRISEKY